MKKDNFVEGEVCKLKNGSEVEVVGFSNGDAIVKELKPNGGFKVVGQNELTKGFQLLAGDSYIINLHLVKGSVGLTLREKPTKEKLEELARQYKATSLTVTRKFKLA